jgi:hypothetical protein
MFLPIPLAYPPELLRTFIAISYEQNGLLRNVEPEVGTPNRSPCLDADSKRRKN